MTGSSVLERCLPPTAPSVREARRLVRAAMLDAGQAHRVDDAQAAVSEVVTNALVHAGTEIHLRVHVRPRGLRVEVRDGSAHLPKDAGFGRGAGTGRGLAVLAGSADAWGVEPDPDGKTVWFEVGREEHSPDPEDAPADEPDAPPTGVGPASDAEDVTAVALVGMPLLTHAAWQEHAASLLREHLLVRLEDDAHAIESHASASAALALLAEQVPAPVLADDPAEIMASAVEPTVTADVVTLRVPAGAVADFEVLDRLLDDAEVLGRDGGLLTAPVQPEVRELRRWLCREVRTQAAGSGGSTGWWVPTEPVPAADATAPDAARVAGSASALVAADEGNRILAVSAAAATLLGYDAPEALVGRRLLSLIPPRYHQAHVAGFTLHLVNGRSPLLGHRVEVPVVLADGREQVMGLRVESWPAPEGRRLYVAELDAARPAE